MRITASKVALLTHCQYYGRPEAEWVNTTSAAADRGTRFHAAIAQYATHGASLLVDEDIGDIVAGAMAWVDDFGREKLAAEVAFAWDPVTDTAERIVVKDRDYSAGKGRLCGTADLVAIQRATKTGYIADWKTGDGSGAGPQLRTLAVMLARAEGLESVTVEALEVTAAGVRSVCREELDTFALSAIAGELAEQLAAIPTAEPQPGDHCGDLYCPARATCPAGAAIVSQVIPAASLVRHKWSLEIASPDHAAWLLDHARLVEAAAKAVKDAVKAAVPPEGWTLEDGSVLREGTREMPRFDKSKALALLKQLGATDAQVDALTYAFTESSGLRVTKSGAAPKVRKKKAA